MVTKVGWRGNLCGCALAGLFLLLLGCETTPKQETKADEPESENVEQPSVELTEPGDSDEELTSDEDVVSEATKRPDSEAKAKTVTLRNQAAQYGLEVKRGNSDGEWLLSNGVSSLVLKEGSRKAYLDGRLIFMNGPLVSRKGRVYLHEADLETLLKPAFAKADETQVLRSRLVFIDPGHGGSEDGATNSELGLLEKELALDVSKRLEEHLGKMGYPTAMTRYDDRVVSLEDRPEIANRAEAGIFVSVHFNASLNKAAQGLETYSLTSEGFVSTGGSQVLGPDARKWPGNDFDFLNAKLGLTIQNGLLERLQRTDRGLKKARFRVLKTLDCPGVLVECGFVSNGSEALLVRTPVYREKLALALADAIGAFMQEYAPPLEGSVVVSDLAGNAEGDTMTSEPVANDGPAESQ